MVNEVKEGEKGRRNQSGNRLDHHAAHMPATEKREEKKRGRETSAITS